MQEITGGSPYGASTTVAGATARMPSERELGLPASRASTSRKSPASTPAAQPHRRSVSRMNRARSFLNFTIDAGCTYIMCPAS